MDRSLRLAPVPFLLLTALASAQPSAPPSPASPPGTLLTVPGGSGLDPGRSPDPVTPDLEKITQELLDAVTRGDHEPWNQYLADDCMVTTEDGLTLTKRALIEQIRPHPAGVSGQLKVANPKVLSAGTTAVITYDALEEQTIYGQTRQTRYHATDTYLFRAGRWQMIASQGLVAPKDPPLATVDPRIYDAYTGTYELAPGFACTVTREGAKLFLQRPGGARQELLPEAEDRFFLSGIRGVKIFVRDQDGRAVQLLDRRDGNDLVWKRGPSSPLPSSPDPSPLPPREKRE